MTAALAAMFAMPCVLMLLCMVVGRRLESFPGKDDVWQLPRTSSLR